MQRSHKITLWYEEPARHAKEERCIWFLLHEATYTIQHVGASFQGLLTFIPQFIVELKCADMAGRLAKT